MKRNVHHGAILKEFVESLKNDSIAEVAKKLQIVVKTLRGKDWFGASILKEWRVKSIKASYPNFPIEDLGYTLEQLGINPNFRMHQETSCYYFESPDSLREEEELINQIDNYFLELKNIVEKANSKIAIYDYLGRSKNEILKVHDSFLKKQEEYFDKIYDHFDNSDISYTRILVLPIDFSDSRNKEAVIEEAIKLLFLSTFEHIWKCFRSKNNKFELFVDSEASRLFSFGYIDDDVILKEHDYYDENKIAHPDIVFIYRNFAPHQNTQLKKVNRRLSRSIDNLINQGRNENKPVFQINYKKLEDTVFSLLIEKKAIYKKVSDKVSVLKEKLLKKPDSKKNKILKENNANLARLEKEIAVLEKKVEICKNM